MTILGPDGTPATGELVGKPEPVRLEIHAGQLLAVHDGRYEGGGPPFVALTLHSRAAFLVVGEKRVPLVSRTGRGPQEVTVLIPVPEWEQAIGARKQEGGEAA